MKQNDLTRLGLKNVVFFDIYNMAVPTERVAFANFEAADANEKADSLWQDIAKRVDILHARESGKWVSCKFLG